MGGMEQDAITTMQLLYEQYSSGCQEKQAGAHAIENVRPGLEKSL